MDAADDGHLLRRGLKIGFQPGHLKRIKTGVDSVLGLALDDSVAVESDEMYAAKVERVVCTAEAIVKELARILVVKGDVVIARTGMKRHFELPGAVKIGLAGIGIEAHISHIPHERGLSGVDLGDGFSKLGDGDLASLDMNIRDESDVKITNGARIGRFDSRSTAGCPKACHGRK